MQELTNEEHQVLIEELESKAKTYRTLIVVTNIVSSKDTIRKRLAIIHSLIAKHQSALVTTVEFTEKEVKLVQQTMRKNWTTSTDEEAQLLKSISAKLNS